MAVGFGVFSKECKVKMCNETPSCTMLSSVRVRKVFEFFEWLLGQAAVGVCEKGEQWRQAWGLFKRMGSLQEALLQRNIITYSSAISVVRRVSSACGLWGSSKECSVNVCSGHYHLQCCHHCVREMWLLVLGEGVQRDTNTHNAAISVCEKCEPWQQTLVLFETIEGELFGCDTSYSCHKASNGSRLQADRVQRNTITYSFAIVLVRRASSGSRFWGSSKACNVRCATKHYHF